MLAGAHSYQVTSPASPFSTRARASRISIAAVITLLVRLPGVGRDLASHHVERLAAFRCFHVRYPCACEDGSS